MSERKVCLFIAMSVDGYIARNDGDISWLSIAEQPGEDYGYAAFTAGIDTYLIGRKTYDKVIEMAGKLPQANDYDCYILTRTARPAEGRVQFYTGALATLINDIRSKPGKHIYCDGGAEVIQLLLKENLIDEMTITVLPILLGAGIQLFKPGFNGGLLELKSAKNFAKGIVQLHYLNKPGN